MAGVLAAFLIALLRSPDAAIAQGGVSSEHVVAWGDTLSSIALRYDVPLLLLRSANGLDATDLIYVGQRLEIPAPGATLPAQTAAADAPAATPTAAEVGATVHTVRYGETLLGIAARYGVEPGDIAAANQIANPRLIYAGQELTIPAPGSIAAPADTATAVPPSADATATATPAPQAEPTADAARTYTVQRGDNLSRIAAQFGVTLQDLLAVNDIADPSIIYAGTVLELPPGAWAPAEATSPPQPTVTDGKQIITVLSTQRLYAYENGQLVAEFLVSTGLPGTPTVQGDFSIYLKVRSQRMTGEGYDLANVEWVSYFYQEYSFHGTWWHSNFGYPMSHGCVNMRTEDAQWLYEWAPLGTSVRVIG